MSLVCATLLSAWAGCAWADAPLANRSSPLASLEVGDSAAIHGLLPASDKAAARALILRRVEVYADDAELVLVRDGKAQAMPRSKRRWFAGEGPGPHDRLMLSLDPADGQVRGMRVHDGGGEHFEGRLAGDRVRIASRRDIAELKGDFQCTSAPELAAAAKAKDPFAALASSAVEPAAAGKGVSTLVARLAIDTDSELLDLKFSDNQTAAANWIADLVAGTNVIYARDLGFELRIGKQVLRTAGDPYSVPGSQPLEQLYEFGEHWRDNEAGTPRAFAALLSGKSSAENRASGIAWRLPSGSWCGATDENGGPGVVAGHYSVTQVFRAPASPASASVSIFAHEVGHNVGAAHTHCTDASPAPGLQPIDTCFNAETASGVGCYSGPISCPAPGDPYFVSTKGTLMSYCNFGNDGMGNGGANCGQQVAAEFNPVQEALLADRVAFNVGASCLTVESGIDPADVVHGDGFEGF